MYYIHKITDNHVHVCSYFIFMYMYIPCTYMFILVYKMVNMYVHVCTMFKFRHVCTDLPIHVHVVRIPDDCKGVSSLNVQRH